MKKNLVKTPTGIPVGEAVRQDGAPALHIQHKGRHETITLAYLQKQIETLTRETAS